MPFPILVLLLVFLLIPLRKIQPLNLHIWQIMTAGAVLVLLTGQITPLRAIQAVSWDVILFLFGMFVVGEALEESGYLSCLAYRLFSKARTPHQMILFVLFGMGIASAFLMNDTLAIIGTPVVVFLAEKYRLPQRLLLLCLAFSITIGSVTSPIGNPQNLLVVLGSRLPNPFFVFFKYLFLPTVVNLVLAYLVLRFFYRSHLKDQWTHHHEPPKVLDPNLARLSQISLWLILILVALKIGSVFLGFESWFWMTHIALVSAAAILLFSPRRFEILGKLHWYTLLFFAAMFILTQSVWNTGFFQRFLQNPHLDLSNVFVIQGLSIFLSQWISNVPLVALYLPALVHSGASTKTLMALAAGSTIAGNLLILGAASNVIIAHKAEEEGESLDFWEFAKVGIPLTILNALVYGIFLSLF